MPFLVIECLPAARSPSGGKATSDGEGELVGDGLGVEDGETVGAPPTSPPDRGNRLMPTTATTTTATAAIANLT
jgi:hypothetical protein